VIHKTFNLSLLFIPAFLIVGNVYAQADRELILETVHGWKQAIVELDIDRILEFYSDNFTSEDAEGKDELKIFWEEMNNCTGTYEVTWQSGNSVAWTYTDCQNGAEVTLVTIDGGGIYFIRVRRQKLIPPFLHGIS
jgi:hypothetical protein